MAAQEASAAADSLSKLLEAFAPLTEDDEGLRSQLILARSDCLRLAGRTYAADSIAHWLTVNERGRSTIAIGVRCAALDRRRQRLMEQGRYETALNLVENTVVCAARPTTLEQRLAWIALACRQKRADIVERHLRNLHGALAAAPDWPTEVIELATFIRQSCADARVRRELERIASDRTRALVTAWEDSVLTDDSSSAELIDLIQERRELKMEIAVARASQAAQNSQSKFLMDRSVELVGSGIYDVGDINDMDPGMDLTAGAEIVRLQSRLRQVEARVAILVER